MGSKIGRCRRRPRTFELCRRSHHDELQLGPDPDRDHVTIHRLTDPDACVESLANDIRQSRVRADLDIDIRIPGKPVSERGPQDRLAGVLARGDADHSGGLGFQVLSQIQSELDVL